MQLFSVLKKKLTPKTWKNRPQKLLIIGPKLFFCMYWPGPAAQNGPETEIPYRQKPLNAGLGI